ASGIGLVLLLAGGSAIVAMQVSGRVSDRLTPRLPSLVGGVGLAIGLLVVAFAPNYPTLVVGGVMIGACNGVMDVAMNALGVDAERASGTAVMSRFHAF
ncbi:MFS transporter, partial [Agromyces sp. NPDC056379]